MMIRIVRFLYLFCLFVFKRKVHSVPDMGISRVFKLRLLYSKLLVGWLYDKHVMSEMEFEPIIKTST